MMPPFFNSFDRAKVSITNLGAGGPEAGDFNTINGRAESLIVPCVFLPLEDVGMMIG